MIFLIIVKLLENCLQLIYNEARGNPANFYKNKGAILIW